MIQLTLDDFSVLSETKIDRLVELINTAQTQDDLEAGLRDFQTSDE
jgi:hypothetical protein